MWSRRKMRVPQHHLVAGPAAELLLHRQGRACLHVPARPCVPQVVEAQIIEAGTPSFTHGCKRDPRAHPDT